MHGPADALEAHLAESLRLPPATSGCSQLRVRVTGQQHLPAMGGSEQPTRPVQDRAEVVAGPGLDLTHVDRHPHEYGRLTPVHGGERR